MATFILHRGIRIVTLEQGEILQEACRPDDIALCPVPAGWAIHFVHADGSDAYDEPFLSYNEALWSAKAAAEFAAE